MLSLNVGSKMWLAYIGLFLIGAIAPFCNVTPSKLALTKRDSTEVRRPQRDFIYPSASVSS